MRQLTLIDHTKLFLTNLAAHLWIFSILLMSLSMYRSHIVQEYTKIGMVKDLYLYVTGHWLPHTQ